MTTMQLEFNKAMSDFKKMFPDIDIEVIEAVLRANQGAVDQTIDQLLAMSTDNQNEKLRNELDEGAATDNSLINLDDTEKDVKYVKKMPDYDRTDGGLREITNIANNAALLSLSSGTAAASPSHTGASPKQRQQLPMKKNYTLNDDTPHSSNSTPTRRAHSVTLASSSTAHRRWNAPMLGMLPPDFLRITPSPGQHDFELPDEQFALMLQNEEFMNQLRWNQDFMNALEKEQSGKNKIENDIAFKERLRNMGQLSRKKFLQMARVFTWQRNKKATTAKQIDSQPLKEEPSDDEDHQHQRQLQQHQDSQEKSPMRK